ncbi:MAG: hypothetical protein R2746_15115 [Acidimicrobiales bacterium]
MATGTEVWCSNELTSLASSSPVIDVDGHLFIADEQAMHAFDRDGHLLWETPIRGVPLGPAHPQRPGGVHHQHRGGVRAATRGRDAGGGPYESWSPVPSSTPRR